MSIPLSKEKEAEVVQSIVRFFGEKLDVEIRELQARLLLKYFFQEIAPFAYNKGVEDAQKHLIRFGEGLARDLLSRAANILGCRGRFASSPEAAELSLSLYPC